MRGKGRLFLFLGGTAALVGCTSLLGSFDSATVDNGTGQDGATPDTSVTPTPDGTTPGSDGSTTSDSGDGGTPPLSCDGGLVVCGTGAAAACVSLDTSGDNCGACGHSCGGGKCMGRKCAPAVIYSVPPPDAGVVIGPLAQDMNDVFFESDENTPYRLLACPKTGCTGAAATPRQIAVMPFSIGAIHVPTAGTIAFLSAPQNSSGTERPAVFSCATTGCPAVPTSFVADGLNGIDARLRSSATGILFGETGGTGLFSTTCANGSCATPVSFFGTTTKGTHGFTGTAALLYFIDSATRGSNIARCAVGDTACTPISVVPADESTVEGLEIWAGKLYWLLPGRSGFIEGKLMSCDLPACATPAPQAIGLDSPSGLNVDASGAYWLTAGNKLQHCPANGCVGGQQDVLAGLDTPHDVLTDDTFIYWAERTKVSRLAK
jgi:hypothetical protein